MATGRGGLVMDFRTEAAAVTLNRLNTRSGAALAKLGESGCIAIPGGRRLLCLIDGSHLVLMLLLLLATLAMLPFSFLGVWRGPFPLLALSAMFLVSLLVRIVKSFL